MITYCSKCGINWAALHKHATEFDDYDFCPVCLTDMHLEEGNSMTAFVMCPVSGKITNVDTKEELIIERKLPDYPRSPGAKPAMKRTVADWERLEDQGLEAYFKSGDPSDYFAAFRS